MTGCEGVIGFPHASFITGTVGAVPAAAIHDTVEPPLAGITAGESRLKVTVCEAVAELLHASVTVHSFVTETWQPLTTSG